MLLCCWSSLNIFIDEILAYTIYRKGWNPRISLTGCGWFVIYWKRTCFWLVLQDCRIWMPDEDAPIANLNRPPWGLRLIKQLILWRPWNIGGLLVQDRVEVPRELLNRGRFWAAHTCSLPRRNERVPDVALHWAWKYGTEYQSPTPAFIKNMKAKDPNLQSYPMEYKKNVQFSWLTSFTKQVSGSTSLLRLEIPISIQDAPVMENYLRN